MTEVSTTLRSAYLAGPMRGHPEFNFPEFHKQAAWLRANGWTIFSPAERDEADEALNGDWAIGVERGLDYFMQFDLAAVCQTDAVIVMSGWEESQGARLEAATAVEIGHPVFEIMPGGSKPQKRHLEHVNPEYIRLAFFSQGYPDERPVNPFQEDNLPSEPEEQEDDREHVLSEDCWCRPEVVLVEADGSLVYDPSLSEARKAMPIASGVLDYFPAALLEVSKVSKAGNDKHNPGQPLHHARGKSMNHADSLLRHLIDRGKVDEETGCRHSAEVAWRALAMLQQELEDEGAPLARGARLPE